jgi:hypothetical protein
MSGAVEGVELLPCPFGCPYPAFQWVAYGKNPMVTCYGNKGGQHPPFTMTLRAWNTRTTPPARSYADGVAGILRTAQADCGCRIPSPFDEVAEHAIGLALATVSQGEKA